MPCTADAQRLNCGADSIDWKPRYLTRPLRERSENERARRASRLAARGCTPVGEHVANHARRSLKHRVEILEDGAAHVIAHAVAVQALKERARHEQRRRLLELAVQPCKALQLAMGAPRPPKDNGEHGSFGEWHRGHAARRGAALQLEGEGRARFHVAGHYLVRSRMGPRRRSSPQAFCSRAVSYKRGARGQRRLRFGDAEDQRAWIGATDRGQNANNKANRSMEGRRKRAQTRTHAHAARARLAATRGLLRVTRGVHGRVALGGYES
jgi:hypothetical protein